MKSMILNLQTFPACKVALSNGGLTKFRKELVKVGNYVKATTGQAFEVTLDTLNHWAGTFQLWLKNGNKVGIPPGHDRVDDPSVNQGWVTEMFVEDDSLYGMMELIDPALALTTDVSIGVPAEVIDGKGNKYARPITHVALCIDPVVPGLAGFESLSLSLSKGTNDMDKKELAKLLGLNDESDEAAITAAIEKLKTPVKIEASQSNASQSNAVDPMIVKLMGENRVGKLNTLLAAGLISPAVKDIIEKHYVETAALTLSLSKGADDGFDTLFEILTKNKTTDLDETSGPQLLELANVRAKAESNPIKADILKRREAAGMKN